MTSTPAATPAGAPTDADIEDYARDQYGGHAAALPLLRAWLRGDSEDERLRAKAALSALDPLVPITDAQRAAQRRMERSALHLLGELPHRLETGPGREPSDCRRCGRDACDGACPARVAEALPNFLARVREMPEPGWLVRDLVPDEGVLVWHGRPRAMKSLTAQEVMLSLALGEQCALGNPRFAIERAVGVLWVGEEDPERLDAFRFTLMLKARGLPAPESFRLVVRPGWDLESPSGQAELITTIRDTSTVMATPLLVLVIDPARASLPSIDGGPKDAAKGRAFLLTILRETSVRVILLPHHDQKPRQDGKDDRARPERASGGVTFSMGDCMVSFERLNDRECMAIPSSYKVSADPQPFKVRFESETPSGQGFRGYLRAIAESTEEDTGVRDKVLEFVVANPWSTTGEVDRGARVRTGEAARYLAQLETAGLVVRVTGPEAKARGRSSNATLWTRK